jgi:hypothetical protein
MKKSIRACSKFYLAGSIEPKVRRARQSGFLRSTGRKNPQFEQALKLVLLALLAAVLCAGCSAKRAPDMAMEAPLGNVYAGVSRSGGAGYAAASSVMQAEASASGTLSTGEGDGAQFSENGQSATAERKLVKRAQLRVRVEDLAEADASINALMERHGAYAASTEIEENSRAYFIRVPHESYGDFLAAAGGMGRTLYRSESAEDVSLRYYDLAGRLATKRELLKTFQSYLGKAKSIEEILSVETRIAELQNEIDGTGKELRSLANLVDFATVALDLYGPVAANRYTGPTLGERIKELFGGFGGFVSTVLVVLAGAVIYGIPLLLLLALLFWLCFGRIGLMRKLWRAAAGNRGTGKTKNENP